MIDGSKIERVVADIVENFIRCEVLEIEAVEARATPDFPFVIPNRRAGALP